MTTRVNIPGVDLSVTRACIVMVIQDLLSALGLKRNTYLYLDDNSVILKIKSQNTPLKGVTDSLYEFVKVTGIEEETAEGDVPYSNLNSKNIPIFLDKELDIDIRPITFRKTITLNFQYGNKDINKIKSLENNLRLMRPSSFGIYYHDLEYSYVLPYFAYKLLEHTHVLKCRRHVENNIPTEDFPTFIRNRSDGRFSYNTPAIKDISKIEISIRERQSGVMGQFELDDFKNIKLEEIDELNAYGINFTYKFTFNFPISLLVSYPILIHNYKLHKAFFGVIKSKDISPTNRYSLDNQAMYELFGPKSTSQLATYEPYLRLPKIDKELTLQQPVGYTKLFTCLLMVDKDNLRDICNVNNMYKAKFTQPYLSYLRYNKENIGIKYKTIIYFCLSKDNVWDNTILKMDLDGNLYADKDLDIMSTYRLHGYFLYDLTMLDNVHDHLHYLKEQHLENVKLIEGELKEKGFDYTNYRNITTKKKNQLIQQVFEVRNKYLSTLEELTYTFDLSKQQVERIIQDNINPSNRFYRMFTNGEEDENSSKFIPKGETIALNLFRIIDTSEVK